MGSLDAMAEARAQKGHIAEATAVTKSSVVFSLLELPKKNHTLYMYIQGRWKLPKAGRASSNSILPILFLCQLRFHSVRPKLYIVHCIP